MQFVRQIFEIARPALGIVPADELEASLSPPPVAVDPVSVGMSSDTPNDCGAIMDETADKGPERLSPTAMEQGAHAGHIIVPRVTITKMSESAPQSSHLFPHAHEPTALTNSNTDSPSESVVAHHVSGSPSQMVALASAPPDFFSGSSAPMLMDQGDTTLQSAPDQPAPSERDPKVLHPPFTPDDLITSDVAGPATNSS